MDIKGRVRLACYHKETGKVAWKIEQWNLVTDYGRGLIAKTDGLVLRGIGTSDSEYLRLCVSSSSAAIATTTTSMSGVFYAVPGDYQPSNPTTGNPRSVNLGEGYEFPNAIRYTGKILISPATIRSVGLCIQSTENAAGSLNYVTLPLVCGIRLDTDYVIESGHLVDVTYDLIPTSDNLKEFNRTALRDWVDFDDFRAHVIGASVQSVHNRPDEWGDSLYLDHLDLLMAGTALSGIASSQYNSTTQSYAYTQVFAQSEYVGRIVNAFLFGRSRAGRLAYSVSAPGTGVNPIQLFYHKGTQSPVSPLYDSTEVGIATGTIAVSYTGLGWAIWPRIYSFEIVTGGNAGTATYRYSRRNFLGFEGNTWVDRVIGNCYNPELASGIYGSGPTADCLRASDTQAFFYERSGFSLINLLTGEVITKNATSTPALPSPTINQCWIDPNGLRVYVASDAGLHFLNGISAPSFTTLTGSACYGIDVGRAGIIYGAFNGRLAISTNWAQGLPFTFPAITNNWASVQFLKADPSHSNDRIAIVYESSPGTYSICWYERSTGQAYQGPSGVDNYPGSLEVSDKASRWVAYLPSTNRYVELTFGSVNIADALTDNPNIAFFRTVNNKYQGKVCFYVPPNPSLSEAYLITRSGLSRTGAIDIPWSVTYSLVDEDPEVPIFTFPSLENSWFCLPLANGISLIGTARIKNILEGNHEFNWTRFSWEDRFGTTTWWPVWGNAQRLGRTTPTTPQITEEGISVSFSGALLAGESYLQPVCAGLLKDNLSSYTVGWGHHYYDANYREYWTTTIPVERIAWVAKAPSGSNPDPGWRRIDGFNKAAVTARINGVEVSDVNLDFNGTYPTVTGRVSVNLANGTVFFASGDIGKTFEIWYTYTRNT